MTSRELNLKLLAAFPEIRDAYTAETSLQDKDENRFAHRVRGRVCAVYQGAGGG